MVEPKHKSVMTSLDENKYYRDQSKICAAPSCKAKFYRRRGESKVEFAARETCKTRCARELAALKKKSKPRIRVREREETKAWIDTDMVSCCNCGHFYDDSEVGDKCGPCTSGQNFVKRKR